MGKDTKDRILDEALVSFVENGYKGTNLRNFAAGMNLSKSALYSHYRKNVKNKQDNIKISLIKKALEDKQ